METKEYPQQLYRLREEQERAIKDTDETINQWQTFKSDYDALKSRLTTLPDKINHDIMVPFGKMAFMPGQLVHTNEILVLLGDNWFVERSAKQAAEIVDRRMKTIDKQLEDLQKQKTLLEPRRDFTADLQGMTQDGGDMLEIREEYDEEKEKKWKESHRKRMREHKRKMKQEAEDMSREKSDHAATDEQQLLTDEQLWERLDQLEQIENKRKEMEKIGTEAERKQGEYKYPSWSDKDQKNVGDKNIQQAPGDSDEESSYSASDELDSDDYDGEEDEGEIIAKGRVIHFTHSHLQKPTASNGAQSVTPDGAQSVTTDVVPSVTPDSTTITHPGDIYTHYNVNTGPTSILKKTKSERKKGVRRKNNVSFDTGSGSDEEVVTWKDTRIPLQALKPAAFTGTVVEKSANGLSAASYQVEPSKPVSKFKSRAANQNAQDTKFRTESAESESVKPVSKFKAQR